MGRSPCCAKEGMNRGAWTAIEDKLLIDCISHHGEGKWRSIPKLAGLKRCGKSCRLRWLNYLRPDIKRGNIQPEEEDLIVRLHRLLGNRWSLIAGRLPGRTDNEIKNYWNTTLSKKASTDTRSISNTIISRKKTMINPTTTGPPSSAIRTKAVKCNRVIITTTVPPPRQTTNHQLDPVTSPGPDPDPNYSLDHNINNNVNNSRDGVANVDIECCSSAAVDELLDEFDGDGGDLSLDDFPMDFHQVVEDQEMGGSDSNFWTLLNDWFMD